MPTTFNIAGYYFFYFAFVGAFTPYFALYLQSGGMPASQIGLLMSMMPLMRLIGPYGWGSLADTRLSRGSTVRLTTSACLAIFTLLFWVHGFNALVPSLALLAFFWSASLPLVETLTFEHLKEKPQHYGRIRMWGSIGFIVAVGVTGYVIDHQTTQADLWASWICLAGIVLFAFQLPKGNPLPKHAKQGKLSLLLTNPSIRALFLSCFLMSIAHGTFYVFFSIYLSEQGYNTSTVGILWSLGVIAEIVVFMKMPWLIHYCGLRRLLLLCFCAAVFRFLITAWLVGSFVWIIFAQLLHGLTFGAHHAASVAVVNQAFGEAVRARAQALYSSLSFGAGGLVGSLLSSELWENAGGSMAFSMSAFFGFLGLLIIHKNFKEPLYP